MSIEVFADAAAAAAACASRVVSWLSAELQEKRVVSLAVSGGGTPRLMFDALPALGLDWQRVHLFFVDERGVPPNDEQSNYAMVRQHLIEPCGVPAAHVHRMHGEVDACVAAAHYAREIDAFWRQNEVKTRSFDVVLCGVGDDGHTASLFPGHSLIRDRAGLTAGFGVEAKAQDRITLLPAPIITARHLGVLASGAEKARAVALALQPETDPLRVPAALLRQGAWFLDRAAASQL